MMKKLINKEFQRRCFMMDKDKNPGEKVTFRIAEAQGGKRNWK